MAATLLVHAPALTSCVAASLAVSLAALAPAPRTADPVEDRVVTLRKERLGTLQQIVERTEKAQMAGAVVFGEVSEARLAALAAELDLCGTDAERVKVLEKVVAESKRLEAEAAQKVRDGVVPANATLWTKARRLEAEIALELARPKPPPK